jgi:gag-polypeptide of LTR copia-type
MEHDKTCKPERLQGSKNYQTWKFSMQMVLMVKDLWGVVGGDAATDTNSGEKKVQQALALISLSLTPTEQEHIIDCKIGKEAWDVLEKLYEGKGRNRKFMLLQELFHLTLVEGSTMIEYLCAAREKISQLARIGTKLDTDVKLAILVNGVLESYRYLVVALELREMDDIDFDELTVRLVEEEQRLGKDSESVRIAFTARWKDIVCFGCGQKGHMKRHCPNRRNGDVGDSGSDVSKATSAFRCKASDLPEIWVQRHQVLGWESKTQWVNEIGCWDGNQNLDRSASSGAGTGIVKNSTGLRRVQGQRCQKLGMYATSAGPVMPETWDDKCDNAWEI